MPTEQQFYLHASIVLGLFFCIVVMWEAIAK